jgi:tetratricopeptide (TPR) repeat protein
MTPNELDARLKALEEADGSGDREVTFRLARELLADLALEPDGSSLSLAGELGSELLDRVGTEFHRRGYHDEARSLFDAGAQFAGQAGRAFDVTRFRLRLVPCLVSLVQLRCAGRELEEVIGESLARRPAFLEAAERLIVGSLDGATMRPLRALAIYGLGRLWAAQGALADADAAYRRVIELVEGLDLGLLDAEEVAIACAEVRIDRGDFELFETLHQKHRNSRSLLIRDKWAILRAAVLALQGRLSESDALLAGLHGRSQQSEVLPYLVGALLQRVQTLTSLNRLDEAEFVLNQLRSYGQAYASDADRLARLIRARRGSSGTELGLPPTPQQEIPMGLARDPGTHGLPQHSGSPGSLTRERERVREDWSSHAQLVELDAHEGRIDQATVRFGQLRAFGRPIDSPLIHAQSEYLNALIAYYRGPAELASARAHAEAAARAFELMGMAPAAWQASVVVDWILRRSNQPREQLEANLVHGRDLLESVRSRLAPSDQIFFLLNKWSSIDKTVSAWCQDLQEEASRTPTGWGNMWARIRFRRRVREVLYRVLTLKRWTDLSGAGPVRDGSPRQDEPPLEPGMGVYSWVGRQIALREQARKPGGHAGGGPWSRSLAPRWLPRDLAVLVYVVLPDRLELFMVTKRRGCEHISPRPPTSKVELRTRVKNLLRSVQFGADRLGWRRDVEERPAHEPGRDTLGILARELGSDSHDAFSAPLDPECVASECDELSRRLGLTELKDRLPKSVRRLAIMPDDVLLNVPFGALPLDGRPLVSWFTPCLISEWRWSPVADHRNRDDHQGLGVAVTRSVVEPFAPPLDSAENEVDRVESMTRRRESRFLRAATRREAVAGLTESDFAHFACHGIFNPEDPFRSGLLLADGWLNIDELSNIHAPRLGRVVLASCWSASTTVLPGREFISLPMSFLRLGTRTVISSIWRVEDPTSPAFMKRLYRAFGFCPPADALALAQRVWWRAGRPTRQWAGYTAWLGALTPDPLLVRLMLRFAAPIRPRPRRSSQANSDDSSTKSA